MVLNVVKTAIAHLTNMSKLEKSTYTSLQAPLTEVKLKF